jgi:hypothetical protein
MSHLSAKMSSGRSFFWTAMVLVSINVLAVVLVGCAPAGTKQPDTPAVEIKPGAPGYPAKSDPSQKSK